MLVVDLQAVPSLEKSWLGVKKGKSKWKTTEWKEKGGRFKPRVRQVRQLKEEEEEEEVGKYMLIFY